MAKEKKQDRKYFFINSGDDQRPSVSQLPVKSCSDIEELADRDRLIMVMSQKLVALTKQAVKKSMDTEKPVNLDQIKDQLNKFWEMVYSRGLKDMDSMHMLLTYGAAVEIAKQFHLTYERLAPKFGYKTREDTKDFDPDTPNGKLMIAVITQLYFSRDSDK